MRDTTGGTRVEEELRARVRQQAVIADLGQRALARTELPALMDEAVAVVARTLDVEYSKVLELLPDGQALLLRAGVGWKDGGVGHATVGAGRDSQAGYTLRSREPVIVEDLRTETRFSGPPLLNDHGVVSGMSVIIHGATGPYGVLGAHTTRLRTFTPDDIHFLRAVANILAMAIERRRTEVALQESERRFRLLAENAQDLIYRYRLGPTPGFEYVSPSATAITGYTPEEHYADPDLGFKLVHPDDRPLLESLRQISAEFSGPLVLRWRRKDGTWLWTEQRNRPIYDEAGNLVAIEGIARDVTQRKQAEAVLRESEARYRVLVETADEVIYRVATTEQEPAGGAVQFVSSQVERILGYRPDEFMEDPELWFRILHPDDRRAVMEATVKILAGRAPGTRQYRLRHKETGEYRWLEDRVVPRTDEHGKVIAIQGAARDVTERKRAEETAGALVHVGHELAGTLDPVRAVRLVLSTVLRLLGVRRAGFYRLDPASGGLSCVAAAGEGETGGRLGETLSAGQGIGGRAVAERRPVWSADLLADPRVTLPASLFERIREDGLRAGVAVPLIARGNALGALILRDRAGRVFTEEDLCLLSAFADQAALTLENARLYEEANRRRCAAEALAELARSLTETLDVATVGERIVESVTGLLGGPMSFLGLLDPDGSLRSIGGSRGAAHFGPGYVAPAGTGLVGRAVTEGRPVWSRDVLSDPAAGLTEDQRRRNTEAGVRAVLAVPLRVRGEIIGALAIDDCVERDFSDAEVELLQHFADQAALALENARLFEQSRRQQREAETVADLARDINASLDLDTVLKGVVAGARELCAGDGAAIALREAGSETAVIRYRLGARYQGDHTLRIQPGRGLGGQALLSGRPARTDNYAEDPRVPADYRAAILEETFVATVVVPVRLGERVEGLLYVGRRSPGPFTDQDEAILLRLADHAAIALQNARLFDETRERLQETRTLLAVGRALSLSVPAGKAIRQTAREVARAFKADMVGIYALDAGKEALVPIAGHGVPRDRLDTLAGTPFPIARLPFLREAWATRGAVWTADYRSDPRFDQDFLGALRPRSLLFAPTQVGGEIVGGLFLVWWSRERTQTPAELRLVEGVAGLIGQALERARVEDALRQSEERFRGAFEHSGIGRSLQAMHGRYLRVNRAFCEMLGHSAEELLATRWQAVTDPRDIAPDLELEAKLRGGQVDSYQIVKRYIHKRGHILWAISTVSLVRDSEGQPAHFVVEAHDITSRKLAEEALQRHHDRLSMLHEIDQAILAARSPETIAQAVLRRIRGMVPCERASVTLFDLEAGETSILAVDATGETGLRSGMRFPIGAFFFEGLRTGAVVVLEDILAIPTPTPRIAALKAEGIRSYVAVPLVSRGALIGALNLAAHRPRAFLTEQTDIAQEVAGSLAVAIQDARLFAQVLAGRERLQILSRRLVEVQEEERRHLARELHDEIGQVLTGLKLTLEMSARTAAAGAPGLGEAQALVDDLLARVRELSLDLRPAMLDDLGLVPALLWHFERYTSLTQVEVVFTHAGLDRRFHPDVETTVYRIVQEALTNVARHTDVSEVAVRLWADRHTLGVHVEDHGTGFEPAAVLAGQASSGLTGMRERAVLVGGRLSVESAPGAGTRLWVELPLDRPARTGGA